MNKPSLTSAIPVVVVNLARAADRRAHTEAQLKGRGLNYQFFEAADGQALSPQDKAVFSEKHALKWPFILTSHYAMSPNEVGCALSHIRIYEWMVKKKHARLLIIEDDVSFTEEFFTALSTLNDWAPPDWDVINFHISRPIFFRQMTHPFQIGVPLYAPKPLPSHQVIRCVLRPRGTVCYLICLPAAKRLLSIGYPVRMPADLLLGTGDLTNLKTYTLFPYLVSANLLLSTIDTENVYAKRAKIYPYVSILETALCEWRYILCALGAICRLSLAYKAARKRFFPMVAKLFFYMGGEVKKHIGDACYNAYYRAKERIPLSWRMQWRRLFGYEVKSPHG